jgi:hypothetical protein
MSIFKAVNCFKSAALSQEEILRIVVATIRNETLQENSSGTFGRIQSGWSMSADSALCRPPSSARTKTEEGRTGLGSSFR